MTVPAARLPPLVDSFGRVHRSVRVSVTDRCNLRCNYCMPAGPVDFLPRGQLLSFEEITRVVRLLAAAGVRDVRITGGEPLVRRQLDRLVEMLAALPGVSDLAMTTNAMLLAEQAERLRAAGLRRLNISLDTLNEQAFQRLTRRSGLQRVLAGIDAALAAGFETLRLNALAIRGFTEDQLIPLVEFATARGLQMRFIEYMPLDAERRWDIQRVLGGDEILRRIADHFGPLRPVEPPRRSQPSCDYELLHGPDGPHGRRPRIGVIRPVTEPFCGSCDRLRLTAEGALRNCLFSTHEWDLKEPLRRRADDEALWQQIVAAVSAKRPGHLINHAEFHQPERAMYRIGG